MREVLIGRAYERQLIARSGAEEGMKERCGVCGDPRESTIHMTDNKNFEIRMGSHTFESDDYVAFLCWTGDQEHRHLVVCDSDYPGAFRVYRSREAARRRG